MDPGPHRYPALAEGWTGDHIVFSGLMMMIGVKRQWRMTWIRTRDDRFRFVNEERNQDGSWAYRDQWRRVRQR
jgi:hypothetical protein